MKKISNLLLVLLVFVLLIPQSSFGSDVSNIKFTSLPGVDFTHGSLANPHNIRIGQIQARGKRIAVLERIYDVSQASKMKNLQLKDMQEVFNKESGNISKQDIVSLMTSEKTLSKNGRYRQHIRIWNVSNPKRSVMINLLPVFDSSEPKVIDPEWVLGDDSIILSQENSDRSDKTYFRINFKDNKLVKLDLQELPKELHEYMDGNESVKIEDTVENGPVKGQTYNVGQIIITNSSKMATIVAKYATGDYMIDENGNNMLGVLNPLVTELGSAGFYVKGYTGGMFAVQVGADSDTNPMHNKMPDNYLSLDEIKELIVNKWKNVDKYDFATFQVVGYRLHR